MPRSSAVRQPTCSSRWIACERVGAADLGVLAAVEELEELDDELDVADAAVAGLDLDLGPARPRPSAARSAASAP